MFCPSWAFRGACMRTAGHRESMGSFLWCVPPNSTLSCCLPVPALSHHVMAICSRAPGTWRDNHRLSPLALQTRSSTATSLDPAAPITSGTMPWGAVHCGTMEPWGGQPCGWGKQGAPFGGRGAGSGHGWGSTSHQQPQHNSTEQFGVPRQSLGGGKHPQS